MWILRRPAGILIVIGVLLVSAPMVAGASGMFDSSAAPDALIGQTARLAPKAQLVQSQWSRPPRVREVWVVAPTAPQTYTVGPGQYLSTIAAKVYGSSRDWPALWWENRAKIPNPNSIRQGLVLVLGAHTPTPAMLSAALAAIPLAPAAPSAPAAPTAAGTPGPSPSTPAPPPQTPAPTGSLQAYAQGLWGSQYGCGAAVVNVESGWNIYATNPRSGAYGIPQALPGSKMASAGADWATNGYTQLRWMTGYMNGTYGGPCGAWAHEQADGWY